MLFGTVKKRGLFEEYALRLQARPAAKRAVQLNEEYMRSTAS